MVRTIRVCLYRTRMVRKIVPYAYGIIFFFRAYAYGTVSYAYGTKYAYDGVVIRNSCLKTDGAAGPSGIDAAGWRRMCTSFQSTSADFFFFFFFYPGLMDCPCLPPPAHKWPVLDKPGLS